MDKKQLSEQEIRTRYITPALTKARWDRHQHIREEVFLTDGKIQVRGRMHSRGKQKFADYILYYQRLPLVVVEAKGNRHSIGDGMQQALGYAEMIDAPFAVSSNWDGFLFHDRTGKAAQVETELGLDAFPGPNELWDRYRDFKGFMPEAEKAITAITHPETVGSFPFPFWAFNYVPTPMTTPSAEIS